MLARASRCAKPKASVPGQGRGQVPSTEPGLGHGHRRALIHTKPQQPRTVPPTASGGKEPKALQLTSLWALVWPCLGKSTLWSQSLFSAVQTKLRPWKGAKKLGFSALLSPPSQDLERRGVSLTSMRGRFFLNTLSVTPLNPVEPSQKQRSLQACCGCCGSRQLARFSSLIHSLADRALPTTQPPKHS